MCSGISLARCEIPESLLAQNRLAERVIRRAEQAEVEFRFLLAERFPVLPIWYEGMFRIAPWGTRDRRLGIPATGWCPEEALESGLWGHLQPVEVFVPATFGWERGVWYQIREGLKGILIRDRDRQPHVYILTRKATHYYEVMTRSPREPVLVGEQI